MVNSASGSPAQPSWNQWSESVRPWVRQSAGVWQCMLPKDIRSSDGQIAVPPQTFKTSVQKMSSRLSVYKCCVFFFSLFMPESVQEFHIPVFLGWPHVTVAAIVMLHSLECGTSE